MLEQAPHDLQAPHGGGHGEGWPAPDVRDGGVGTLGEQKLGHGDEVVQTGLVQDRLAPRLICVRVAGLGLGSGLRSDMGLGLKLGFELGLELGLGLGTP